MTALEFTGTVTNGHFPQRIREQLAAALRRMEGKRLEVVLREPKRFSSDPQRRYYFAVIVPEIQQMFYEAGTVLTKDETHHWLMIHVGKWLRDVVTPDGEITQMRRSYTDLSTMEAETHHTLCRQWAAEHGRQIPEPNETIETE